MTIARTASVCSCAHAANEANPTATPASASVHAPSSPMACGLTRAPELDHAVSAVERQRPPRLPSRAPVSLRVGEEVLAWALRSSAEGTSMPGMCGRPWFGPRLGAVSGSLGLWVACLPTSFAVPAVALPWLCTVVSRDSELSVEKWRVLFPCCLCACRWAAAIHSDNCCWGRLWRSWW